MLLLTLERLGVRDPRVDGLAVRRAARIGAVRDPQRGLLVQSQFQGALALIERLRLVRRLSAADVAALVTGLAALESNDDGTYGGAVAEWIRGELLPRVGIRDLEDDTPVIDALAGMVPATDPTFASRVPTASWLECRIGLISRPSNARDWNRSAPNRKATPWPWRWRSRASVGNCASLAPTTPQAVVPVLSDWASGCKTARSLDARPDWPWAARANPRRAIGELRETRSGDAQRVRAIGGTVLALADIVLADVLRALAYAPYLGSPDGPLLLGGDVSQRHDFGFGDHYRDTRLHAAWSLPDSPVGYGLKWQIRGSLLGLDVGLAGLALPQVTTGTPDAARSFSEQARKALPQGLAVLNSYDLTDEDMKALTARIRRGRARAAAAASDLPSIGLTVDAERQRVFSWLVVNERAAADRFFSCPTCVVVMGT